MLVDKIGDHFSRTKLRCWSFLLYRVPCLLLISEDSEPLTDNVVFISVQSVLSSVKRVLDIKRAAFLLPRSGTGLAEGETGQAKPDLSLIHI